MKRYNIKTIADYYGISRQMNKLVEELGEAVSAASEAMSMQMFNETSGKPGNTNERLEHLLAELADVSVMISQMLYLVDTRTTVDAYGVFEATKASGIEKTLKRIDHEIAEMKGEQ